MAPDPLSVPRRLVTAGARAVDDLGRTADRVGELPGLLGRLLEGVERLTALVVVELPRLAARVDDVSGMLEDVRVQLRAMEAVPGRLDELLVSIGALRTDVEATRSNVSPMDEDLDAVERAVREMVPALMAVRDEVVRLREDLSSVPFVGRH